MAAAAESAEGFFASRPGRALAFGCSFLAFLLAAGALTITLLGRPGGPAAVTLELGDVSPAKPKTVAPMRPVSDEAPVAAPVAPVHAETAARSMRAVKPAKAARARS